MTEQAQNQQPQVSLNIARIYLKDQSFEAPNLPELFAKPFDPAYEVQLNSKARQVDQGLHEVVLTINVECKTGDTVAFIAEVQQAGLFQIEGLEGMNLRHALSAFCPNVLFPYARQQIAAATNAGGFPPLNLNPVNFDQLFAMQLQQEAAKANGAVADAPAAIQ